MNPKRGHCPFCGYDVNQIERGKDDKGLIYWVMCSYCDACGPVEHGLELAVDCWNRPRRTIDAWGKAWG